MKQKKKPWGIFLAIVLAIAFGALIPQQSSVLGVHVYPLLDLFGTLFLNALTLVVVPLVSSSFITGVARIGGESQFGRLGAKTFGFYIGTSLMAVLIGLFFVNIIHPGSTDLMSTNAAVSEKLQQQLSSGSGRNFEALLKQMVPTNILHALSHGNMLGLIFFCLLFGYAISKIPQELSHTLQKFFDGIFQTMIRITHILMKFLPYGVFCLVAKVFMSTGIKSLQSVAWFCLAVLLGLATFMFIAMPLILKFIGKINPNWHLRAMAPALVTAFSTSSSSATLPVTIDCVEKRAGVSNRICSLVVPLGNSINMSGSALYECVAAMFVAQSYGIEISFVTQVLVVMMALVTSMGVAGIPSGSLVAILIMLKSLGLPSEGIGLFVAVDRLLDMARTTVNVYSDSCCAVLVAKTEGEHNVLSKHPSEMESMSS